MNVLIPVDGSECALMTLAAAARFLDRRANDIYLLYVITPIVLEMPTPTYEASAEVADDVLRQARKQAERAGLHVVSAESVFNHDPALTICDYADRLPADLILMGSHGYRGLARVIMGSVSEKVFRHARQPVIILRNDPEQTLLISHRDTVHLEPLQ